MKKMLNAVLERMCNKCNIERIDDYNDEIHVILQHVSGYDFWNTPFYTYAEIVIFSKDGKSGRVEISPVNLIEVPIDYEYGDIAAQDIVYEYEPDDMNIEEMSFNDFNEQVQEITEFVDEKLEAIIEDRL